MSAELDLLKDIPGYRAILKSVLKAQIQMLMEQLSTHTGEESIVLTASIHDGSLCHLGSEAGKGFLEGKDELKAEFLGFCLKCEHTKEKLEKGQYQGQGHNLLPPSKRQRPRIRPGPYSMSSPSSSTSIRSPAFSQNSSVSSINQNVNIKNEVNDKGGSYVESNEVDHVTPAANENSGQPLNIDDDDNDDHPVVKIERDDVDDDDTLPTDESWELNGNQDESQDGGSSQPGASHLGGIAFPGLDNAHHDFSSKPLPEISSNDLKQALYPQDMLKENVNINSINDFQHNGIGRGSFSPHHRKKGRPPKSQSLSRASHHFIKSSSQYSDNISLNSAVRKRGRPRKNCDEDLPPGVVHPMGISIGNGHVKCNICGKILKATSMFSHKQSHLGIRNYSCEFCGKSFTQKGPLITHKRVHTGEKPYTCPRCGKCFAAHSGLYQHSRRCDRRALMD